ncbi:hypothetical protein X759_15290 [Mesorhizobium sp. LSHC420B00]|nr:hypothetical protein X759_15290 [Mesorhizobium sp. LSHC420B00]
MLVIVGGDIVVDQRLVVQPGAQPVDDRRFDMIERIGPDIGA